MKLNPVNFALGILISALVAYGFYGLAGEELRISVTLGAFWFSVCTLAMVFGVRFEHSRTGSNLRVVGALGFTASIGINTVYSLATLTQSSYVIVSGIAFALYALVFRAIASTRQ